VAPWTPERQEQVTGVSARLLRELAIAHGRANGAALYMATGVNQGRSGTLCFWLLESINAITGNLDRRGGTLMGEGLIDMAREMKKDPQMMVHYARKDGLPTVSGLQPSGMLADDILGEEPDRVTALLVEASNPILACGNPDGRLTRALEKLELLVSIDLFRNEVGSLAHYVLPAPSWLERPEIPYALQSFAGCTPKPYIIYADPVVDAPPDVRPEWWMFIRLADAAGVTVFENRFLSALAKLYARLLYGPVGRFLPGINKIFDGMFKKAGLPSISAMSKNHPHGLLLPENEGENFLGTDRVLTPDGKIDLAPKSYVDTFSDRVEDLYREELDTRDRMKLIGKREIRRMNSCSSNSEALVREKTNYAYLSLGDAARIGVQNNDLVEVVSLYGKIEIPVRVTEEMMDRTVAIPQCWGHKDADGLAHARKHPGVNSNLLAGDGPETIETLSGMSHLSGILVDIRRVASDAG
jgi:anaerobic selenocysteine-containing dehydrogenase